MPRRPNTSSPIFADVVIVGGNHSGLTMAAVLGSVGVGVICCEQASAGTGRAKRDGRTVALSYRSVKLLDQAGVWKHLEATACPIHDIRVADQDSHHYLDFHAAEVGDHPFGWIVENVLFKEALERRLRELPNVRDLHGAAVEKLESARDSMSLILKNGSEVTTRLAIAADGRGSPCRDMVGIPTYGWSYDQTAVICTIAHSIPHNNVAVEHFQPAGPFATLPMTGQRSSIVWTERPAAAKLLMAMDEAEFVELLQEKVEPYLGKIKLVGERGAYPLNLKHARRYTAERLALVGDAAHGIHPIAGQGLNLGMGDIEVLAEEITKTFGLGLDIGTSDLLRRYEKRRRFDNGNMILVTDILDRLFSNAIPPVQLARRWGLSVVNHWPGLRRFFMRAAMGVGSRAA